MSDADHFCAGASPLHMGRMELAPTSGTAAVDFDCRDPERRCAVRSPELSTVPPERRAWVDFMKTLWREVYPRAGGELERENSKSKAACLDTFAKAAQQGLFDGALPPLY